MKILNVKQKSIVKDANGTFNLKKVMARRFKNNGYTHIKADNQIYNTSIVSGIVWIDELVL